MHSVKLLVDSCVYIEIYTQRNTEKQRTVQLPQLRQKNGALFFLVASLLAALVLAAVSRRANSSGARASCPVPTILVGDCSIARSMLVDHARTFSNKPVSPFPVEFVTGESANLSHSINTVPHGPLWRAFRCNLTAGIFHPSRLDLLAPLQQEAIDGFIEGLHQLSSGCGDVVVVDIRDRLHTALLALLMRVCFGDGGADARDVRAVQRVFLDFADGMVHASALASSRTTRLLQWRRWRRFLSVRDRLAKLLLPLIEERQRRRPASSSLCSDGDNGAVRPFVDSLLDLQVPADHNDGGSSSVRRALTDDEKVTLVWEFLDAGTETVVTCVEWTLAHLVDQPEVQKKLHHELVDGGVDRRDVDTPYLRAVILESLRLHPPVPVIQRDVVVRGDAAAVAPAVIGVHVPELENDSGGGGTVVRFTIVPGAIGRDSRAWTDPDEFRPERFLAGGEGESVGPTPGPKDIRMLPFGAGTRQCPGKGVTMVHVRLFLAALVQAFHWGLPATAAAAVDFTELDGFVKHMKTPLKARITPRHVVS